LAPFPWGFFGKKAPHGPIPILGSAYPYVPPAEKAQLIQQATNAGIATRNELREIIGLPPEENGDELVTNLNNVRIGSDSSNN